MATVYGLNATLRDNTLPSKKIDGEYDGGRMHFKYDEYTIPGVAMSSGDLINMMKLPKGAILLDAVLCSADLDSGSSAVLDIGWAASSDALEAASANGILASVDAHTAAVTKLMSGVANTANQFKKFLGEVQVQVKVTTAGDSTSGKIKLGIYYTF